MYAAVLNTPFIMSRVRNSSMFTKFSVLSPSAVSSAMILITVQCIHKVSRKLELGYLITY